MSSTSYDSGNQWYSQWYSFTPTLNQFILTDNGISSSSYNDYDYRVYQTYNSSYLDVTKGYLAIDENGYLNYYQEHNYEGFSENTSGFLFYLDRYIERINEYLYNIEMNTDEQEFFDHLYVYILDYLVDLTNDGSYFKGFINQPQINVDKIIDYLITKYDIYRKKLGLEEV